MTSFDNMCREAAKRFIQTVAIIDDAVTYEMDETFLESKKETVKPPVSGLKNDKKSPEPNKESKAVESQTDRNNIDLLDARVVINAFADMGIVCCIQRPKHEKPSCERATKLATSADVLVLDWVLDQKNITLPRDIIKRVLKDDKNKGGRMRLIVVYTSHNYVDQMLKDLKEDADEVYDDGLVIDKKHLFIKSDCLRIVILNKKATLAPPREARIVPFNKLPDNIISEYVELVKGVIPSATLHGIAAMREKTHKVIYILNSKLDGAYCLHRALLSEPSDSVDFAMNLITNEIETVIKTDVKARQFVDNNGLKAWFNNFVGKKTMLPYKGSTLSVDTVWKCINQGQLSDDKVKNALDEEYSLNFVKAKTDKGQILRDISGKEISLADATELIKMKKWNHIKKCQPPKETSFAEVLYTPPGKAINECNELSHLQCTIRDIGNRLYNDNSQSPTLQLGTILKKKKVDSSEWYLCLTPLCDCVRLEKETDFFFLQLTSRKGYADLILKIQEETFEPLVAKANNKKIKLLTIPFERINRDDRIHAKQWQGEWRMKSLNGISYQWVAELRYTKALAIVHYVATNTSRVGVDDFEWLRRQESLKN